MSTLNVVTKLITALPKAGNLITKNASALAVRLGISSGSITSKSLVQMARNNKVTAAFIAYEIYGAGSAIVEEMREADPQLAAIIETLAMEADEVEDTDSVNDITKFKEEFHLISKASRSVGGLDDLIQLRKALSLSDETFQLYMQVEDMQQVF